MQQHSVTSGPVCVSRPPSARGGLEVPRVSRPRPVRDTCNLVQDSLNAMQTTLRVLSALIGRRSPYDSDIAELRKHADGAEDEPLDELACHVIQREMESRDADRKSFGHRSGSGPLISARCGSLGQHRPNLNEKLVRRERLREDIEAVVASPFLDHVFNGADQRPSGSVILDAR